MFILDNYLNNSNINTSYIEDVEMTNEGYTINGGVESVLLESEEASHKMNMLQIGMESKGVMILHEASMNGESQAEALEKVNMLMEKVSFGILEKIKDLVKRMWAKMKEIVNSLKMALAKAFSESKYIQMAAKALEGLSDFTDFEYEGYNYDMTYDLKSRWVKAAAAVTNTFKGIMASIKEGKDAKDSAAKVNTVKEAVNKAKDIDAMDKYCKAGYGCKVSDLEKTVFKTLRGGAESKTIIKTINKDAALNILKEFKSAQADISAIAKSIDDSHKEVIAILDELIAEYSKEVKNDTTGTKTAFNTLTVSVARDQAAVTKEILNISNRVTGYKMAALKEEKVQAKAMVSKAISVGKKNKKKAMGKLNASTEFFLDESYLYDDSDESFTNSNSYGSDSDFINGLLSNI